jgi:eukaryotic-like serine/threonine-protein kinase
MALPGRLLADRYELLEPIATGGMATVWRARDLRLDRPVAVKVLLPQYAADPEFLRRFEVEARHAASLSHPNVATVFDTGLDGDERFIVMELVDGPTIADVLRDRGPLEPHLAVSIAAAAARGLAAAHRRGLIHRDVKPANLLLGRDGRVQVADFGIARALTRSRVTVPGTVLGSIPYLSPEQARGEEPSARADVFSLGVVLFEMLTGELPWDADTPAGMATVRIHTPARAPSSVRPHLSPGLDAIVGRALALDPADRYSSAGKFAGALETWNRSDAAVASAPTRVLGAVASVAAALRPPAISRAFPGGGAVAVGTARVNPAAVGARPRPIRSTPRTRRTRAVPRSAGAAAFSAAAVAEPVEVGAAARVVRSGAAPARPAHPARPAGLIEARSRGDRRAAFASVLLLLLILAVGLIWFAGFPASSTGPSLQPTNPVVVIAPPASPSPAPTSTASPAPTATPTPSPTPSPTPAATVRPVAPAPTVRSPADTVRAFYAAVARHDWNTAIGIWSPSMRRRYPPQQWLIDRFRYTTRIDITSLRTTRLNETAGTANVAVSLVEYRTVSPTRRTFVGSWDLVRIDGRWYLNDPHF